MSLSDPISNMLTNIRNAIHVKKETVDVPASRLAGEILEAFKKDGYIEDFRLLKNNAQGTFKVYLRYNQDSKPAILGLKRISRPGIRVYVSHKKLPRVLNGLGTAIISTSKGILTDRESRENKVGGEVLCYIW